MLLLPHKQPRRMPTTGDQLVCSVCLEMERGYASYTEGFGVFVVCLSDWEYWEQRKTACPCQRRTVWSTTRAASKLSTSPVIVLQTHGMPLLFSGRITGSLFPRKKSSDAVPVSLLRTSGCGCYAMGSPKLASSRSVKQIDHMGMPR